MPHSNHVENGRNVCWRRASVKKGATFRKLFTAIVGAHFKSATEIVVNNLCNIIQDFLNIFMLHLVL